MTSEAVSTSVETPYVARDTLTVRVELVRQLRRRRTLVAFGLAMVLIMVFRPRGLIADREPSVRLHPAGSGAGP